MDYEIFRFTNYVGGSFVAIGGLFLGNIMADQLRPLNNKARELLQNINRASSGAFSQMIPSQTQRDLRRFVFCAIPQNIIPAVLITNMYLGGIPSSLYVAYVLTTCFVLDSLRMAIHIFPEVVPPVIPTPAPSTY